MKIFTKKYELPLVPLRDIVVFPHTVVPFVVSRGKSKRAIEEAQTQKNLLFLATQKNTLDDNPTETQIHAVGVTTKILQAVSMPDASVRLLVEARERASIVQYIEKKEYFRVAVTPFSEGNEKTPQVTVLMGTILQEFLHLCSLTHSIPQEVVGIVEKEEFPDKLIHIICTNAPLSNDQKLKILSEPAIEKRLNNLSIMLTTQIQVMELQQKITDKVKQRIEKTQKEYFLNEQIREIRQELGNEKDDPTGVEELRLKLRDKNLPKEISEKCEAELKRLSRIQPISPESGVLRTYLEWIGDIPWSEVSQDKKDIQRAQQILDEDHYNLKKVKERILDFIAVRHLTRTVKGPILCFVGPPGTGKTSLGKSVARCLGRKFVRISLGGVRDEAEIRGHRKTYVGALPGKILQSM